jgi:SAM-dependent methyltransferase
MVVEKLAYYRGTAMRPALAARYYDALGEARRILDVGCGVGEFGRYKPAPDIEVYGVDVDAGALEHARRFEHALCIDLEREPLPYEDGSFDAVLARDVLEHLQDPGRMVREIHRVLRPGGVLIASVVVARPARVWADYTHVRGFTRRAAQLLFEDAGLAVERVWRMGPVPLASRLRLLGVVPYLLSLPGLDQLWTSSWELRARRPVTEAA